MATHSPSPGTELPSNSVFAFSARDCTVGASGLPRSSQVSLSGRPTPSRTDIEMTKQVIDTAKPLGIAVHDHIIIGKNGYASMKGLLLI